ncbi:MAG: hypothetical protein ACM3PP_04880 [Candidatus Saccharibacteria bacterium]
MTDGWRLLGEGNPEEALEYFEDNLTKDSGHFANHWGRGRCLLMLEQKSLAVASFKEAIKLATASWSREEISYEQVEAIEKDLDKASDDNGARVVERFVGYIHGALNIAGVYSYSKTVSEVEKLAKLNTSKLTDQLLETVKTDSRFHLDKDHIRLALLAKPQMILERRKQLGVKVILELDKIARYCRTNVIDEWKDGISGIVTEVSCSKLSAEDVILGLLNSATLKQAMHDLEQKAGGSFGERENQWERFIFNLWVALPRWELGGLCLNESRIEDLWLGDMSKAWIGSVLGLMVDGDGDFCCPECREKVLLYDRHTHGVFDR